MSFLIILGTTSTGPSLVMGQYNPYTKITDDIYPQYNPAIYGNYVVYEDIRDGSGMDIYLYNIESGEETKLNSGQEGNATQPDISGDRIVWQDNRSGEWKIYTYLISNPDLGDYLLLDLIGEQNSPAIHENRLVWIDHRGDEYSSNILYV